KAGRMTRPLARCGPTPTRSARTSTEPADRRAMRSHRSMIKPWTRWSRKASGFTLLEMIAVIVIVAILAAVAVPTIGTVSATRGASAARQLLRDLTFARQRAASTGVPTWVAFDVANEKWTVLAEDPDNPGRAHAAV